MTPTPSRAACWPPPSIPHGGRNPLPLVAIANELLARWDRPLITTTIVEGDLNEALPGLM